RAPRRARAAARGVSPRLRLVAGPYVVAVLIHAEALILVKELPPQQPARILWNAPQPLLGGLLRGPLLRVHRDGLGLARVIRAGFVVRAGLPLVLFLQLTV